MHYLETRFRDQNEPTPGVHLGKERKEVLDRIIREITLFMNIMGWNISNTPQPPPSTPSNTFRLDEKTAIQYGVQARFEVPFIGSRKTIVLEGSDIAPLLRAYPDYMNPEAKEQIQRWFTVHPGQYKLNENVEFDSPTAAVAFVTGHHMSGPAVMVRETDGKTTLKTLRDAQK
ncbi:MAG: hypothetical protein LIO63_00775 [Akkermansia sp.]|nr:hypothetical protein [Akkermansia sp.]